MNCIFDGIQVASDVAKVGEEVKDVVNKCKSGSETAEKHSNSTVSSKMYNCPAPWVTTPCIKSSWMSWKDDRAAFQRVCNDGKGRLVDFPDDSKAIDCGKPCFACSFIGVCCDPKGPPNVVV